VDPEQLIRALILPAFGLYLVSAGLYLARLRRAGIGVAALAFGVNAVAVFYRGIEAGHLPFSNMYETMITLAACMFPFLLFSEFGLKSRTGWIDGLLAAIILFPSAFEISSTFTPAIKKLPPALRSNLFFPHVMTYLFAYAALSKAMILSVLSLAQRAIEKRKRTGKTPWVPLEKSAYRITGIGFPLLTAGLLLGAVWAKQAWGDYWSWDPKEVWSLITWLVYLVYFHLRAGHPRPGAWSETMNLIGFGTVIVTLLAVNLSGIFGGLHAYA